MGIMFGITVLKGTLKLTGGIEAKGSLPLRISGTVAVGTGMLKDCSGLDVVLEVKLEMQEFLPSEAMNANDTLLDMPKSSLRDSAKTTVQRRSQSQYRKGASGCVMSLKPCASTNFSVEFRNQRRYPVLP
jgi:hypothetical protein